MKDGDYHQEDLTEVFRGIEEEQGTKMVTFYILIADEEWERVGEINAAQLESLIGCFMFSLFRREHVSTCFSDKLCLYKSNIILSLIKTLFSLCYHKSTKALFLYCA